MSQNHLPDIANCGYDAARRMPCRPIALSESAVALLRFRVKKWPMKIREQDRPGYQELVDAGILEPDGDDYRFTDDGGRGGRNCSARRKSGSSGNGTSRRMRVDLSEAARELLRTCIAGNCPDGDETNRPAYRELVKARIMIPMGSFTKGDECVFRFTYWGWKRRYELAEMSCTTGPLG